MQLNHKLSIIIPCMFLMCACSSSKPTVDLESLFIDRDIEGAILISSLDGDQIYQAFPERVKKEYLPASTFKIPNTLIALEEEVISSPDEVLKWDGEIRFVDAWNQDHSLRSAFPVSCVWYYQELARRIGNQKYLNYLQEFDYGNGQTGTAVDRFWLDGDLRITIEEQIVFLKKLYKNALPIQKKNIELLKEIMIFEETDEYTIRAKTGWAIRTDGEHGWWVGYVSKKDEAWFFAINIEITSIDDYGKQKEIVREALMLIGVLPQMNK